MFYSHEKIVKRLKARFMDISMFNAVSTRLSLKRIVLHKHLDWNIGNFKVVNTGFALGEYHT